MPIQKQPFRPYKLEEERGEEVVKSIWLNKEDQQRLEKLKELLNVKSDSKAFKIALTVSLNLIGSLFGDKLARYLFKKERQKLDDFKNFWNKT